MMIHLYIAGVKFKAVAACFLGCIAAMCFIEHQWLLMSYRIRRFALKDYSNMLKEQEVGGINNQSADENPWLPIGQWFQWQKLADPDSKAHPASLVSEGAVRTTKETFSEPTASLKYPWTALGDNHVIFSTATAFLDSRQGNKATLRLLFYKNHAIHHEGYCLVRRHANATELKIPGSFDSINAASPFCRGGCAWRYEAYYFVCPIDKNMTIKEVGFQLRGPAAEIGAQFVHTVRVAATTDEWEHEFGVCVKPMYSYREWMRIVTFMEIYRQLGATYFYLYNHSVSEDVSRVLKYYQDQGIMELVYWPSIPKPHPEPSYFARFESLSKFGQMLTHNDCVLRAAGKVRYLAIVDLDEIILPRRSLDGSYDLVSAIKRKASMEKYGGFQVRSSFVDVKFPPVQRLNETDPRTVSLPNIFGQLPRYKIERPGWRTKMIVRPETVEKQTVHQTFRYLPGYSGTVFSPEEALIYHMRDKSLGGEPAESVNLMAPLEQQLKTRFGTVIQKIVESRA